MVYEIKIPVKSFLLKYLSSHHPVDPFVLSERNRFGLFLIACLRHTHHRRSEEKYTTRGATTLMPVLIKEHYEKEHGIHISRKRQYQFNTFLQDEFYDEMLRHVALLNQDRKGDIKNALHDLREKYGITEDDLPFKTLEKMYERQKGRLMLYVSEV